ncbi:MAG: cupin domain-containing protein [Phycisphaeraceae bacterium]|nr:cupin domain-containing protein [Phycisphaeraceae bacterium]
MDEKSIGANIRGLREKAQLTVTALATQSQLTKSTLSKIETGQVSSPISTLMRIAAALDVPLADFFVEPTADPLYVLTRKGEGQIIAREGAQFGYFYEALALQMRHKRVEPFLLTISPGDPMGEFRHGGQEFLYMLSGRLQFTVGDQKMILRAGDSIYFDPTQEHTTQVLGKQPAKFLSLFIQDMPDPTSTTTRRGRRVK